MAPIKIAFFPLLGNRKELVKQAKDLFEKFKYKYVCEYDGGDNIGKRYRRQDEIGTPYCVTVDFDSIGREKTVTVRDRDSMKQERVKINNLDDYFRKKLA